MKRTMPTLFCFLLLSLLSFQSFARNTIINDPALSRRCEQLMTKRNRKKAHCQRLVDLISRNQRLQKAAPKNKQSIIKRLFVSMKKLKQKLRLGRLRLEKYEEDIIKKGCPGIQIEL